MENAPMISDDREYRPYGLIYKYTFPRGDIYIGKTTQTIDSRFEQHRSNAYAMNPVDSYGLPYKGSEGYRYNSVLYQAWRQCGRRQIKIEEIDQAYSSKELADKERDWIIFYDSVNSGLNTTYH